GSEKVLILKPHTMMNLSGQAVGEAMRYHKLSAGEIVVFHDEIDLAPGKCRFKFGGGHAGNNGLRSIHAHIGEAYGRVRIGVGHPGHKDKVPGYVLKDFPKADEVWLDDVIRGCSDGAAKLADGDAPGFMNAVALRAAPQRAKPVAQSPQPAGKAPAKAAVTRKSVEVTPEPDKSPMQALLEKFSKP
ncbi:MAG: aminoacyl-tRNA hydrolase, partial [Pikeienuella sp.]